MKWPLICLCLCVSVATHVVDPLVLAQGDSQFEAIVSLTQTKMREYRVPGVAIGIIDHGVVTTRGLGVTNVEDPLPITDHTVFPIASISKTFAATMMMRLVEQGKVDRGQSIEFIRARDGSVNWIRVVGRIAVRTADR